MTILEKIKNNVEEMAGLPFVYGSGGEINRALDNAPLPCVFSYLMIQGSVNDENGILHDRVQMAFFFVDKTRFDFDAMENEEIIDRMKKRAFAWYNKNRVADGLRFGAIANSQRVYDEIADATVTGYALNVEVEEIDGVSHCNEPE